MGRPPGKPNIAQRDVRARARRLVEDKRYAAAVRKRLIEGTLSPHMEATLWAYAYGRPVESHKHEITGVTKVIEVVLAPEEPEPRQLGAGPRALPAGEPETHTIDVTPDRSST